MNPFADTPAPSEPVFDDEDRQGFDLLLAGYHTRDEARVEVPYGVTQILPDAFRGHAEIQEIVLPDTLQSIGEGAFRGCGGLREASIPEAVFEIGERAFSGCSALARVRLPEGLLSIPRGAFGLCSSLEEIEGGWEVYEVGEGAFRGCASLHEFPRFPELETIGAEAFSGCGALAQAGLPDTVKDVGAEAFRGCSSLAVASLPPTVAHLGRDLFAGCARLERIEGSEELVAHFPDAFPRDIVNGLGMTRAQDRRHDEWAYQKAHADEIAALRERIAALRIELRRVEDEAAQTGLTERARRRQLKDGADRLRARRRALKERLDALAHPAEEDLLAMALQSGGRVMR
ncbi:MAG: leucine-rich repeat domain-containing protein [Eggerthellaceae bacterium]|nr:leucine-rich repeat domain-containing protein [Eggerthellaceae bacterium]